MRQIEILAYILLAAAFLSIIGGTRGSSFFLPALPAMATGRREILDGYISPFFANTIDYAFFLLIAYAIIVFKKGLHFGVKLLLSVLFLVSIIYSGSVASIGAFLIILYFAVAHNRPTVKYAAWLSAIVAGAFLFYYFHDAIIAKVENMKLSRLGMIMQTLPDFIGEFSRDTFFGTGCKASAVLDKVNSYPDPVHMLYYYREISAFGDVFWVAMTVYHGLIGLGMVTLLYWLTFAGAAKGEYADDDYNYRLVMISVYLCILWLGLFNQVLAVRPFSMIFWLFAAFAYTKKLNFNKIDQHEQE
jgi:hypothetical protein